MPEAAARTVPGLTPALRQRLRWLFRVLTRFSPELAARLTLRLFQRPRSRVISAEDAAFLRPARTLELTVAGVHVRAYEWPGADPAVLVMHGWISYAARLGEVIRAFVARGRRVLALDAPAHGGSGGRRADLDTFTDSLRALSRERAPVGAVVAHSFGAMAACRWLAEDVPEVRAAVLIGLARDVGYLFESFSVAMDLRPEVIERARGLFHRRYGAFPEDYSALSYAERIRAPVLLVHGSEDEFVPAEQAAEIARHLPQAQLLLLPGFSHSAPLRDPATVAAIVQFVESRL
jgi:alpha-beta hydrolase superfamily lysophospholipase